MNRMTVQRHPSAIYIEWPEGRLKLEVVSDTIIHVLYTKRGAFSTQPSIMVLPRPTSDARWTLEEGSDAITLATSQLRLRINRATAAFTWLDARGDILVREPDVGGKHLMEIDVEKRIIDASTIVTTEQTVDGMKSRTTGGRTIVDRKAYTTRLDLQFSPGEAIYGLGQHEEGILNYRGHTQYLYQQNMKVAMPVFVSTRGYGIFFDTNGLATFHDDEAGSYFWTETDDEMDFYFIVGPEFDQIVAGMRLLTGRPTMYPRWAYGYVQSKERYVTGDELLEVVQEYRRRHIPLDCIVLDWRSWVGDLWGQKTMDPQRFPDPSKLTADLHEQNVRMMVSIWPIMRNECANQVEMREKRCLLGDGATYNAFDPLARATYWKQANEGLFSHGIDAWWCDCTEPFEADWNGSIKPEPWKRVLINAGEAMKYLDPEYINVFSLLHSQGIYEGQRSVTTSKRVVNLTRSGYPGQQRYGTTTWAGDTAATWDRLRRQIPDGLNFCVTGNPRWTLDIGAFFVGQKEQWFWRGDYPGGCTDEGYRELYVRWFQLGAFLPMFRAHGTDTPREVWRFGEPGSITYDTLVKFIHLRYRLLPYIYSLAAAESTRDYTIMRMLAFDFREDSNVYGIKDQFMFGPALMACPVTEPMYYESGSQPITSKNAKRPVYLPAGADWYDFWTGQRHAGGQSITAIAPMDIMPLFVRAGSIIPLGPIAQHAEDQLDAPIELRVYPGADGRFEYYEDENDNYNCEKGLSVTIPMRWDDRRRILSIGARQGSFPGMHPTREFRAVLVQPGRGAGVYTADDGSYDVVPYNGLSTEVSL